jgi:hypothetical protein
MAKELEEGQTASQQDAGTGGEGQQSADAGGAADSGQQADGSVQDGSAGQGGASGGELEKLRTDYQELQSKFTETSQELARNREMMETIKPYIDYSRLQPPGAPQAGQQPNVEHEGEEVYLTDRQVKELLIRINNFARSLPQETFGPSTRMCATTARRKWLFATFYRMTPLLTSRLTSASTERLKRQKSLSKTSARPARPRPKKPGRQPSKKPRRRPLRPLR